MSLLATIVSPINDIVDSLGPNDLPYAIPVHPNLVHLTIGLFSIGIQAVPTAPGNSVAFINWIGPRPSW